MSSERMGGPGSALARRTAPWAVLPIVATLGFGCRDKPSGEPAAGSASVSAASTLAPMKAREAPCAHAWTFPGDGRPDETIPEPYDRFDPCQILTTFLPDYDRASERSRAAGGLVRLDATHVWKTKGQAYLAVLYYVGKDAELEQPCVQCRVTPRLAVIGGGVAAAGDSQKLFSLGAPVVLQRGSDDIDALFDGRAAFDEIGYSIRDGETLLGVSVTWSVGMPGAWDQLTLFRLSPAGLAPVFKSQVDWRASGGGTQDDERMTSTLRFEPRLDAEADILVETSQARCRLDTDGPELQEVCQNPVVVATAKYRFEAGAYRRIEGDVPPKPSLLSTMWDR